MTISHKTERENNPRPLDAALSELMDEINLKRNQVDPSEPSGICTGFPDLDRLTNGLRAGSLIVIGARPAMGKTSLAFNVALNVALEQKLPVAIFSMEMSSMQLAERLVCQTGGICSHRVRSGRLDPDNLMTIDAALEKLRAAVICVDDTPALKAREICSRAWEIHGQHGQLGLIVVDYLQCMCSIDSAKESERVMSTFRDLARELDAPVVVLSQLNRKLEKRKDKRPRLSDFVFGRIVQSADLVMFLYRDEYYKPNTKDKGTAELIVARNRHGPVGTIRLRFDDKHLNFKSIDYSS